MDFLHSKMTGLINQLQIFLFILLLFNSAALWLNSACLTSL